MKRFFLIAIAAPFILFSFRDIKNKDPVPVLPSIPIYFYWGNANGGYSECIVQHSGGCGAIEAPAQNVPPPKGATKAKLILSETDGLIVEFQKNRIAPDVFEAQFGDGRFYQQSPIQWDVKLLKRLGAVDTLRTLDAGFHIIETDNRTVRILL